MVTKRKMTSAMHVSRDRIRLSMIVLLGLSLGFMLEMLIMHSVELTNLIISFVLVFIALVLSIINVSD